MYATNKMRTLVIAMAMIFTVAATQISAFAQVNDGAQKSGAAISDSDNNLEGVWQTVVTFSDCQTGATLGSFKALRTIASGGTVAETNPSFPSSGHGVWRRTGDRRYTVNVMFYAYDPTGDFGGNAKIVEYIRLSRDADSYTSTSTFQFVDPSGTVVDSGCSTETATRAAF
jgi:hypothetical protein